MSENAYVEFLKDVIGDEFNQEHSKETVHVHLLIRIKFKPYSPHNCD